MRIDDRPLGLEDLLLHQSEDVVSDLHRAPLPRGDDRADASRS
jgi:hypothetical protein